MSMYAPHTITKIKPLYFYYGDNQLILLTMKIYPTFQLVYTPLLHLDCGDLIQITLGKDGVKLGYIFTTKYQCLHGKNWASVIKRKPKNKIKWKIYRFPFLHVFDCAPHGAVFMVSDESLLQRLGY